VNNIAQIFEKERIFTSTDKEWIEFIENLSIKRFIIFNGSVHNDTTRLDTNNDIWFINFGGRKLKYDFTKFNNIYIRKLIKWISYKFISFVSLTTFDPKFIKFLGMFQQFDDFHFDNLFHQLNTLILQKKSSSRVKFTVLKRIMFFLIDERAPTTEIEDGYILEQDRFYYPDVGQNNNAYALEIRFNILEIQLIIDKCKHDFRYIKDLNYTQLRDFVLLRVCYEIGLRPLQLYKLSHDSLVSFEANYYLVRPVVKKGKKYEGQKGKDKLQISPELGQAIKYLISKQTGKNKQLFQHENGGVSAGITYTSYIRSTLKRWTGSNLLKTVYDFRHNMAHNLAMSGTSASSIAYMLGHNSLKVANYYISATPYIAIIRQKALGENDTYSNMVAILTGEVVIPDNWNKDKVSGIVGNELVTGIGGCGSNGCEYTPIYSCYACQDFNPFEDAPHIKVLQALKDVVKENIKVSDLFLQTGMNPILLQLEGVIQQVKQVIKRCEVCKYEK